MRTIQVVGALCLLALVCFATGADLRTSDVDSEKAMEYTTTSGRRSTVSPFEKVANWAYRRSTRAAPTAEAPASGYPAGECPAPRDDLCTKFNHDCAGCLATPGCGYCNDFRQCLPSAGDNPDVLGCECEVWMNEPKQCTEEVCSVVAGCSECSKKPYCVWCPHEQLCMPGGFFGIAPNKKVSCRDWRWLRCEGVTGNTILIIAGSTSGGILVLFFATCVVYHKCYSPVKHSSHMSDELEESAILEEERNLLSGHHEDEHNERMAEARRSIIKVDPALDLKDNSAALKEPRSRHPTPSRNIIVPEEPVTLDDEDEYSQSETDDDMVDFGTPQVISDLKARLNAQNASSGGDFGKLKMSQQQGMMAASSTTSSAANSQKVSFKNESSTSKAPSSTGSVSSNTSSQSNQRASLTPSSTLAAPSPTSTMTLAVPNNPSVVHPGLPAPSIPTTPEPSVFVDATESSELEDVETIARVTRGDAEFNPRASEPSNADASPSSP